MPTPQRSSAQPSSPPHLSADNTVLAQVPRRQRGSRLRTAFTGMNRWIGTLAETGAVIGAATTAVCRSIWGLGWRTVFLAIPLIRLMRHRSSS